MNEFRRARVELFGRVQGVGFRYFAEQEACGSRVTGFVRNRGNGSVLAEVQGTTESVSGMIRRLEQGPPLSRVDRMHVDWIEPLLDEHDFLIRD